MNLMNPDLLAEMVGMLPEKQRETLWKILEGISTGQIAKAEEVASSTISKRISSICKKFDEILTSRQIVDGRGKPLRLSNKEGYSYALNQGLIHLFGKYMPDKVSNSSNNLEEPVGVVAIESGFYIERQPLEEECRSQVVKSGALIRIRAPGQMGKTSLINRILGYAAHKGLVTVLWDLSALEQSMFGNLDLFLRCFCQHVIRQLRIENRLDQAWDNEFLSRNLACTDYFEEQILTEVSSGLVIGIDNLDRLFAYREICDDFLGLLRSWHGKSDENWQKVRLIISHSTEDYSMINVNQSPFNVGIPVSLPEFSEEQVKDLASRHGLVDAEGILTEEQLKLLNLFWSLLGGHPYLQRLWMYHVAKNHTQWQQIYQLATTDNGIYAQHLRRLWGELDRDPELKIAMQEVISPSDARRLNPRLKFHLHSLGLAKYQGNEVKPRCQLYADYFKQNL